MSGLKRHPLMLTDHEAASLRVAIVTYVHADSTDRVTPEEWLWTASALGNRLNLPPAQWNEDTP